MSELDLSVSAFLGNSLQLAGGGGAELASNDEWSP
jgi:hypothetical protein